MLNNSGKECNVIKHRKNSVILTFELKTALVIKGRKTAHVKIFGGKVNYQKLSTHQINTGHCGLKEEKTYQEKDEEVDLVVSQRKDLILDVGCRWNI